MRSKGGRRSRLWRWICLAVLGLALVWLVVFRSFPAYLAKSAPNAALVLNRSQPVALAQSIQQLIAQAPRLQNPNVDPAVTLDATTKSEIHGLAARLMTSDPLNARPFAVMACQSRADTDSSETNAFMQATFDRSRRESEAVYWLLRWNTERKNFAAAVEYLDVLFGRRPQVIAQVMPLIGRIAESEDGRQRLKLMFAGNPPWRATVSIICRITLPTRGRHWTCF